MAFEFHLPDIGEGVVEGEIVSWKVKEGDVVKLDQPIVEIMTDKATVEIPSPRAGRIAKIHYAAGQICPVGKVLLSIDESGGKATADVHAAPAGVDAPQLMIAAHMAAPTTAIQPIPRGGHGAIEVIDATPRAPGARVLATPATRRIARQLGVDLGRVAPTGKRGRVTTEDVRGVASGTIAHGPAPVLDEPPARTAVAARAPIAIAVGGAEERVPLRGLRKRIAENMQRAAQTVAQFTYVEEIDMTELVAVRERAKARAAERGVKLTYLPFIVKAVVSGLKKWPQLNAALDESTQEIVRKKYYHVGVAAQGPQGLSVSVLRDADRRSIFELAKEIERLGEAVRTGTATRDELTGSTFTISSLGKLGGVMATPIVNFPEVGIVGVHKIEERPAVRNGQIVARWLMNLSISLDHRLVDGWDGAMFLQDVKALLEDPTTMFMEMI